MTPERKEVLLAQARNDRLAWINVASIPYRIIGERPPSLDHHHRDNRVFDQVFDIYSLPSAVGAIDYLYQHYGFLHSRNDGSQMSAVDDELVERIIRKVDYSLSHVLQTEKEMFSNNRSDASIHFECFGKQGSSNAYQHSFSSAYRRFIWKLQSPQCAELVQQMRIFVASLRKKYNTDDSSNKTIDESELKSIALTLNGFISYVLEDIKTKIVLHSLEETRRCLEVFLYAHCYDVVWSLVTVANTQDDDDLEDQMKKLHFIGPSHLEIKSFLECEKNWADKENSGCNVMGESCMSVTSKSLTRKPWEVFLSSPVQALQSLCTLYSPLSMLDSVVGAYEGINKALSLAASNFTPGADEVLPSFILALLLAKPIKIFSRIRFVEMFAPQGALQGKTGYAFTCLCSAVQYIHQLDFEELIDSSQRDGNSHVSICPVDLIVAADTSTQSAETSSEIKTDKICSEFCAKKVERQNENVSIRASDVRLARECGKVTDFEWAQHWYQRRASTLKVFNSLRGNNVPNKHKCTQILSKSGQVSFNEQSNSKNGEGLIMHCKNCTLAPCPESAVAKQNNEGVKLFKEGRFREAMSHFQSALCVGQIARILFQDRNMAQDQQDEVKGNGVSQDTSMMHRLDRLFATLGHRRVSTELYVYQRHVYDEGMSTFSDLLVVDEKKDSSEDNYIILCFNVALLSLQMERFDDAFVYMYVSLIKEKQSRVPRQSRLVAILHNIGRVLYLLGFYADSLSVFTEALISEEKIPGGGNNLHIASFKTCIGCVRWRILQANNTLPMKQVIENQKDILDLQLGALSTKKGLLGSCHMSVAASLNLIGCIYGEERISRESHCDEAMVCFQDCLKIRRKFLPGHHPDISQVLFNIARIHHSTGGLNQALDLYKECLRGLRSSLGDVHRDVSATLLCMAWIYRECGRNNEALRCCERALKSGIAAFVGPHTQIGMIWNLLGHIYRSFGELNQSPTCFQSAIDAFSESLRITKALDGDKHRLSSTLISIGDIKKDTADYEGAIHSYKLALPILQRRQEKDPFDLAATLNSLGYCYTMMADLTEAVKMFTAAVNLQLDERDERQIVFANSFNSLRIIFNKLGEQELANISLQESERIKRLIQNHGDLSPAHIVLKRSRGFDLARDPNLESSTKIEDSSDMKRVLPCDSQMIAQLIGSEEGMNGSNKGSVLECFLQPLDKIRDHGKKKATSLPAE